MIAQFSNAINYFDRLILNELKDVCATWIGGGSVRDYFSVGYITGDVDLYFSNKEEFDKCHQYFMYNGIIEKKDGDIVSNVSKPAAFLLYENDNVCKLLYKGKKYDLVKKFFSDPETAINAFDFTVSCAAIDRTKVYTHPTFFVDLAKRALVINKLPYPMSTLWRMQKYIKKGYTICSGGLLDIAKAISSLELHKEKEENASNPATDAAIIETEFYPDGTPKFKGID